MRQPAAGTVRVRLPDLREAFHQNVVRNEEPAADGTIPFARVKLTERQSCPYLRKDGLCMIQRHTEEKNGSETCRTHPRVVQFWGDGYAEVSLQLSCPMASELVLSDQPCAFRPLGCTGKFKGLRYRQESSQCGISLRNFHRHILQVAVSIGYRNDCIWQIIFSGRLPV